MSTGTTLEDLPYEVLSLILSHLPLRDLIAVTLLSRTLLFIASDPSTTPFHAPIQEILDAGPPYPSCLATLGTYTHIPRTVFAHVLIRASPTWILEHMVIPAGITHDGWQRIFCARFLPSWKRYRDDHDHDHDHDRDGDGDGDRDHPPASSWRAVFLRILGRLAHRSQGCTHEEAWTRFIVLHRNGTASLNRMYSRTFDPSAIYQEIRRQNDLMGYGQEVREVVRLQDVRILVYGTMASPRSLWVNPNAYVILHPPGLVEDTITDDEPQSDARIGILAGGEGAGRSGEETGAEGRDVEVPTTTTTTTTATTGRATGTTPTTTTTTTPSRHGFMRTRSLSFGRHAAHVHHHPPETESASSAAHPAGGSSGSGAIASLVSRIRGTSLAATPPPPPPPPTTTPRRTSWLGRTHSRDEAVRHGASASAGAGLSRSTTRVSDVSAHGGDRTRTTASERAVPPTETRTTASERAVPPTETRTTERTKPPTPHGKPSVDDPLTYGSPYPPLREPLPAPSHALYPNWTPPDPDAAQGGPRDTRPGRRVAREKQKYLAAAVPVGAEWNDDDVAGGWRTWIGPVLIIAQLCPAPSQLPRDADSLHLPPTADGAVPPVSLGPPGMYASFDWEDLDALFPWLELRQAENGNDGEAGTTHRAGLGFAR
ncbi:hypothetical protein NliqN6_5857 [Naganishia liquefaciens]|uniref:F-box domain-containing protein n=1 Tax=Naganishia liquefaciens TaxID=104408 RepID=A0A8H3YH13_9TREE|nr:hypothetical protein NliqN6_5857 [Naganishia liquefaciens]